MPAQREGRLARAGQGDRRTAADRDRGEPAGSGKESATGHGGRLHGSTPEVSFDLEPDATAARAVT